MKEQNERAAEAEHQRELERYKEMVSEATVLMILYYVDTEEFVDNTFLSEKYIISITFLFSFEISINLTITSKKLRHNVLKVNN